MLACPGRCATVRRQTAQRTSGSCVTVTGWRPEVELLIGSILPAGSHSCPVQGVDAEQCRVLTAGRRSAQASLAVHWMVSNAPTLPIASFTGSSSCGVTRNRFRSARGCRRDSATATVHALPGPVGGYPARYGIGERYVEVRSVGPHPGLHRDVPLLGRRGIQVDAADDVVVARVEDGKGETGAPREVLGVAAKVGQVLLERHAVARWPLAVGIAGSRAYVFDARHPGGTVGLVVLRPQWFEAELAGDE